MSSEKREFTRGIDCKANLGMFWFMGWLFSIGFLGLHFWKAVLAILLWPYFLGVALH